MRLAHLCAADCRMWCGNTHKVPEIGGGDGFRAGISGGASLGRRHDLDNVDGFLLGFWG